MSHFSGIDPEDPPTTNLFYYIQDLARAYDERWSEYDAPVGELVAEVERMAADLLASGTHFRPSGQISTLAFGERVIALAAKNRSGLVSNAAASRAIQMAILKETADRIHLFEARLAEIIGVVRDLPFDGFTQRYLEEMSRLYLDGHDTAVYIVARAALEEALKEVVEHARLENELRLFVTTKKDESARSRSQSNQSFWPSLEWMISFACARSRLLPRELEAQATSIRLRGNWAVHEREKLAEAGEDFPPVQAIKSLAAILKSLSRWKQ